jgi:hypothetical protein
MVSLACHEDEIFIGNGNGEVKIFGEKLNLLKTIKICGDVISDIKVYDGCLLAITAYDGTIAVYNLKTGEILLNKVQGQLFEVCRHQGCYYIAGTRSYKLDEHLKHAE